MFLQRSLLLITALYLAGGHWGVLQVVAWSKMLAEYSAANGLAQGLEDTFDGEHGCPLCHMIEEGQKKEQKETPSLPTRTEMLLKVYPSVQLFELPAPALRSDGMAAVRYDDPGMLRSQWIAQPATPPPREVLA